MTSIAVSVAIATADHPEALARCLDALAEGADALVEVVVIDQGATTATAEVVRAREHVLPRLRLVTQERRGLSASRNLGLRETSGPVLAVTDDDCVPDRRWIAAIASALGKDASLAGVAGPMLPWGTEQPGLVAVSSRTSLVRADHRGGVAPWIVGTGGNMAVRREWIERVGGWDERLGVGSRGRAGEDVALVDRLLAAGAVIRYEPEAIVRHERRTQASRRATRWSYGHGIGGACGILLREGHGRGVSLLARWLALRLRLAASSAAHGRAGDVGAELRVVGGTMAGLVYGLRAGASS